MNILKVFAVLFFFFTSMAYAELSYGQRQQLYRALENGDVAQVQSLAHVITLTPTEKEEFVQFAKDFLAKRQFEVSQNQSLAGRIFKFLVCLLLLQIDLTMLGSATILSLRAENIPVALLVGFITIWLAGWTIYGMGDAIVGNECREQLYQRAIAIKHMISQMQVKSRQKIDLSHV